MHRKGEVGKKRNPGKAEKGSEKGGESLPADFAVIVGVGGGGEDRVAGEETEHAVEHDGGVGVGGGQLGGDLGGSELRSLASLGDDLEQVQLDGGLEGHGEYGGARQLHGELAGLLLRHRVPYLRLRTHGPNPTDKREGGRQRGKLRGEKIGLCGGVAAGLRCDIRCVELGAPTPAVGPLELDDPRTVDAADGLDSGEPTSLCQFFELLQRPLLPTRVVRQHEHVHLINASTRVTVVNALRQDRLNHDHLAVFRQRLAAVLQQLHTVLIPPVMKDQLHNIN
ncbi:hypothetical protein EJ110_NYTH18891 [Nymphaea thermarum]|nr:hypothetical protein EJ110_NYTH18891 [Nymphaea thermarum]